MPINGKEAIRILQTKGFEVCRQRGSHVVLVLQAEDGKRITVVPMHKELKKGTLRSIAKLANIDVKEFGL
jgi:predicted RNA binding protein YcfA (HicA-like mRNA interferase family)